MNDFVSFIPLGGIGDVTRNMYLYEYKDEILIVDCGLGFADETMLGVDLLLPDISYLISTKKKIVGLVLTHGHEDHIGALPFVLPQLKTSFPIFGTPFTSALAQAKLKEFGLQARVNSVEFGNPEVKIGNFKVSFIHVTHSIPDSSNLLIQTPIGNFYHGSDFKFDETPWDKKPSDLESIEKAGREKIIALFSDCLGSERKGYTPTEFPIFENFVQALSECKGKFIVTTYSSHIDRINQVIKAAEQFDRKVCFVGRSLIKTKEVAKLLGFLKMNSNTEIQISELNRYPDEKLVLLVAGSQGQENSAMSRIVDGAHLEVKLKSSDTIVFSSTTIPGNEILVNSLIDSIARKGVKVLYSELHDGLHVSGHGSQGDLEKLISLTKPKSLIPIGGNFRHMAAYKTLAENLSFSNNNIFLLEDGQEVIFDSEKGRLGKKIPIKKVYVDEISGEEVESFVLRDRQKISEGGIVVALVEIDSSTGQIINTPDIIVKGFIFDNKRIIGNINRDLRIALNRKEKGGLITNWTYVRRLVGEVVEKAIFKSLHRRPLVLPVVIEV